MADKTILADSPTLEEVEVVGMKKRPEQTVKLDPHGLPLLPQPSSFKDDPLVSASVTVPNV